VIVLPAGNNINNLNISVYNVEGREVKYTKTVKDGRLILHLPQKGGIYFVKQGKRTLKKVLLLK